MSRYLKELPPSPRGKYQRGPFPGHAKIVTALRKKPGMWLDVKTASNPQNANAFARKIRDGIFIAFQDGKYEAYSVGNKAYARFIE